MSSKINVLEILRKHKATLSNNEGEMWKKDRRTFVTYPILIGIILSLFIGIPNENWINIMATCLSLFVGLFLNLLVLVISFADNKNGVEDVSNRTALLKESFHTIAYTIVLSLFALGVLLVANICFFPSQWGIDLSFARCYVPFISNFLGFGFILSFVLYAFFHVLFIHLIMTLLMVIKRIFKLFDVEIAAATKSKKKPKKE